MNSKSIVIGVSILFLLGAGVMLYTSTLPPSEKSPTGLASMPTVMDAQRTASTASTSQITVTSTIMKLESSAFENNGEIPRKYTCDGEDISPPLAISEVPENARTLVLIVDDPDAPAGDWVHWVVFNIPASTREIAEASAPAGALGATDFGRPGWGGPCPPSGTHRYFFKLYALDTELEQESTATKAELETAMAGHILDRAQLMGTYKRS